MIALVPLPISTLLAEWVAAPVPPFATATCPVKFADGIPPVPVISFEFKSRSPPNYGVVSSTTFEIPAPAIRTPVDKVRMLIYAEFAAFLCFRMPVPVSAHHW